jgi:hypothetical protein
MVLVRRVIPQTRYPCSRRNSARYEPSCPVIPVIRAVFVITVLFCQWPWRPEAWLS